MGIKPTTKRYPGTMRRSQYICISVVHLFDAARPNAVCRVSSPKPSWNSAEERTQRLYNTHAFDRSAPLTDGIRDSVRLTTSKHTSMDVHLSKGVDVQTNGVPWVRGDAKGSGWGALQQQFYPWE